jgi:hypothetical protein
MGYPLEGAERAARAALKPCESFRDPTAIGRQCVGARAVERLECDAESVAIAIIERSFQKTIRGSELTRAHGAHESGPRFVTLSERSREGRTPPGNILLAGEFYHPSNSRTLFGIGWNLGQAGR